MDEGKKERLDQIAQDIPFGNKILHDLVLYGEVAVSVAGKLVCTFVSCGCFGDFAIEWVDRREPWFSTEYAKRMWSMPKGKSLYREIIEPCLKELSKDG